MQPRRATRLSRAAVGGRRMLNVALFTGMGKQAYTLSSGGLGGLTGLGWMASWEPGGRLRHVWALVP
jgi:hypothetical protein